MHRAERIKLNKTNVIVTHPLFRLLLLGPILRSLAQRDGDERERIFKRPPLPWRESLGATGVKTPDNQSGILNFHSLPQSKNKNHHSPVWRKQILRSCKLPALHDGCCCRKDLRPCTGKGWLSGLIRFEAKQWPTDSPADCPRAKCVWGTQG